QLAFRLAALEHHAVQRLLARDLYLHALGQRVGDRDADAMQAARRPIHLRVELSPRVQCAHDHFERGFVLELRLRIDGTAPPFVGTAAAAGGLNSDRDEAGTPGERLVHGIVAPLREKVVQRLLVGAADIHARTPAHRLEAFEHFDVAGGVAGLRSARGPASAGYLAGEAARSGLG